MHKLLIEKWIFATIRQKNAQFENEKMMYSIYLGPLPIYKGISEHRNLVKSQYIWYISTVTKFSSFLHKKCMKN